MLSGSDAEDGVRTWREVAPWGGESPLPAGHPGRSPSLEDLSMSLGVVTGKILLRVASRRLLTR